MKKLYTRLMMAIVAITMAVPAKAAVESVAELFGTYRMTANVEIIDQAYKDKLSGDCEVKIMADPVGIYACEIDGLFGIEDSYQQVSKMVVQDDGKQALRIVNPNGGNWDAWGTFDGWMANADGSNPFGAERFGPIFYTLNEDGSVITLPDFSFVKMNDTFSEVAGIIAKFTNVKLTLVKKDEIEVSDISGNYHFTPNQDYDYEGKGANFPREFDMTLANKGDNKAYDVTLVWANLGELKLEGKFDGSALNLPINNTKLGEYILFDSYQNAQSNITFNLVGDNLKLTSGILFAEADSTSVYWVGGGLAKLEGEETPAPSYVGTYKAKATIAYLADGANVPTEGDIVIEYDETYNMYFVTSFMGYDTYTMNYGGLEFRPDPEDPKKGAIVTEDMYQFLDIVSMSDDFKQIQYLVLRDVNGALGEIPVTFDEDGNMTIKDCSIFSSWEGKDEADAFVAYYSPIVAEKQKDATAIECIKAPATEGAIEYFNLNGMKTTANQKGIVLMKKGGKVVKVLK